MAKGLIRTGIGLTAAAGVFMVVFPSVMDATYSGERYDVNADGMLQTTDAEGSVQVHDDATVIVGDQGSSFYVAHVPAKAGGAFPALRLGIGS